jgi:hypothetical protein
MLRSVPAEPDRVYAACLLGSDDGDDVNTTFTSPIASAQIHGEVRSTDRCFACFDTRSPVSGWKAMGASPALQPMLGHTPIATTQRYARLGVEVVKAQAERTPWNHSVTKLALAVEAR